MSNFYLGSGLWSLVEGSKARRKTSSDRTAHWVNRDEDRESLKNLQRQILQLQERIQQAAAQQIDSLRTTLECALKSGRLLVEVKSRLGHGKYGPWIRENLSLSDRTARIYLELARHEEDVQKFIHEAKRQSSTVLSIEGALKELRKRRPKQRRTSSSDSSVAKIEVEERPEENGSEEQAQRKGRAGSLEGEVRETRATRSENSTQESAPERGTRRLESPEVENPPVSDWRAEDHDSTVELNIPGSSEHEANPEKEWLTSLSIRNRLGDSTTFDSEALLWRHTRQLIKSLNELLPKTSERRTSDLQTRWQRSHYSLLLRRIASVAHPRNWSLCKDCRGQGSLRNCTCDRCAGAGFLITCDTDFLGTER